VRPDEWNLVGEALSRRGHRLDVSSVRRFTGGIANENYLVQVDGGPAVLRRPPGTGLAAGANDMAREWRVLTHLSDAYPLAPRPLAYIDDLSLLGVPFQLIEFRPGQSVGASVPEGMPADAPALLSDGLIAAMVDLHALDTDAIGLGGLGSPAGFLARQLGSWHRRAAVQWPAGIPAALERLAGALARSVPDEPDAPALLHMDFKFDNMLFDLATVEPRAVIDWDMATRGPAVFDLAVLLAYWVQPDDPADVHTLARVPSLQPGFPTRAELAEQYFARSGTASRSLVWHLALARLRLAVLWMQLFRAWERGAVVGDVYADFDSLSLAILDWAEHHYMKGTL
jgi:aminoglycoside phosphotransferase (APT) family kinase protein